MTDLFNVKSRAPSVVQIVAETITMSRRLSPVFMILITLFFSRGALARDGGDRHGGVFKGGHVREEHFEGSRRRNYGEFEFFPGSLFFAGFLLLALLHLSSLLFFADDNNAVLPSCLYRPRTVVPQIQPNTLAMYKNVCPDGGESIHRS